MIAFLLVSFLASVIGAICGIGGGVIIKPVLDMLALESVAAINFLSGCTVLSMSSYSVGKSLVKKEKAVNMATGTPLAVGAALGGILGKELFSFVKDSVSSPENLSAIQAVALGIITVGTLIYTVNKSKIHTHNVKNKAACVLIGVALGVMSSFLGIGGGPINLVVLYFFFSMDTKTAASNSLYIIFFSQLANLIASLVTGSVPEFNTFALILMICGGIGGGIAGRALNKKINNSTVEKLFIGLMSVIILICVYNAVKNLI
ncbi:MAG: sulfite exporter TauE/SafE family protein [Clostridia bacterium]|nr:sulfite exporter TauE/SafE family protein [Clostridia bacterium]